MAEHLRRTSTTSGARAAVRIFAASTLAALGRPPLWPRWFWPLFAAGLVANLLPLLVAPILPFADLHGHAGLLGAMVHRGDPAARIDDYFTFHVRPSPNAIFWVVGWPLTQAVSVTTATNLYLAMFCVVGLPVSLLVALRAHGKDPVLSFLAFPLIYHRCLWYGFAGNVAAVPLLLLTLALASLAFAHPRAGWRDLALALALLVLSTAHAFLYLVTLCLVILWALLAIGQPSRAWRRVAVLLPSLLYLGPWLGASLFGRKPDGGGFLALVKHVFGQRRQLSTYFANVHEWLINGYAGTLDEWVAGIFVATLLACLIFGLRSPGQSPSPAETPPQAPPTTPHSSPGTAGWRWRIAIAWGVLGAGYFLLPMSILRPLSWWAVNVRLLVPCVLVAVLLVPWRPRGLPRAALIPVMASAIVYGGYLTHDFRSWFMRVELDGFSQALAAIPPGKRVHALYPPFDNERHYSHFPMGYVVDYYTVERGGTAVPFLWAVEDYWVGWRPQGPSASWGLASAFRWQTHGRSWDYFLAKQPAPGNGPRLSLFTDAPAGAVSKVFERGLWSVWKRER